MSDTNITIKTDYIKLNQLLKLAEICMSGGEAKAIIANGEVSVNGAPASETRKKVFPGDYVTIGSPDSNPPKICILKA